MLTAEQQTSARKISFKVKETALADRMTQFLCFMAFRRLTPDRAKELIGMLSVPDFKHYNGTHVQWLRTELQYFIEADRLVIQAIYCDNEYKEGVAEIHRNWQGVLKMFLDMLEEFET